MNVTDCRKQIAAQSRFRVNGPNTTSSSYFSYLIKKSGNRFRWPKIPLEPPLTARLAASSKNNRTLQQQRQQQQQQR